MHRTEPDCTPCVAVDPLLYPLSSSHIAHYHSLSSHPTFSEDGTNDHAQSSQFVSSIPCKVTSDASNAVSAFRSTLAPHNQQQHTCSDYRRHPHRCTGYRRDYSISLGSKTKTGCEGRVSNNVSIDNAANKKPLLAGEGPSVGDGNYTRAIAGVSEGTERRHETDVIRGAGRCLGSSCRDYSICRYNLKVGCRNFKRAVVLWDSLE